MNLSTSLTVLSFRNCLHKCWQKRHALITFNAMACALMMSVGLNANAATRDCTKLTATGNPEYPPYLFRKGLESEELLGANTEILNLIAKQLGIEIEVSYSGPWSRAQKEVREGRIDLIAGAFFTVPRAQYMDYIYPAFLTTNSVVWSNIDRPVMYQTKEDLVSYKGITVIHNSFGQEFDEFAKNSLDIMTVPKLRQAFRVLNAKRADYLLYERSPAQAYANIWGVGDSVESSGPPVSSEGLYLTLSHKSECNTGELRGKLTKAVRDIIDQGLANKALQQGHTLWKTQNEGASE